MFLRAVPLVVAVLLAAAAPTASAATSRMLPFPSDAYTKTDRSSPTGRVLDFRSAQMPRNGKGRPIDPVPYRGLDGFSPGSTILAQIPGLQTSAALKRTGAVTLSDIGAYSKRDAPVLVLDAKTGARWPIWAELDANATKASERLLEIHPARNLREGRRYVVVLRDLRRADGARIRARRGTTIPSRLVSTLKRAHVRRDASLYAAWDFTVASERSLSGRMLHLRDTAFAALGDTNLADGVVQGNAPAATVEPMPLEGDDAKYQGRFAQVLRGTVDVPCFLTNGCAAGGRFALDAHGLPRQQGTYKARFICVVPDTATPDNPARLVLYGHGLLGSEREALTNPDMPAMAREGNMVFCATPWIGMSSEDIPNAIGVLGDLSNMPTIADRLQQGFLDALVLGRLMAHPAGLAANPLLQAGGRPIVQTGRIYYDGNSQGGIDGGALTALAPDFTRAVLGVPGMNYSLLLPRSSDFDAYSKVLYPAYPRQSDRPLALAIAQILWDRGEADAYAQHMTDDPLPNTPRHQVLMDVAFGDHQVSQFTADVEARTIGARIHAPALAAGRSPQRVPSWGIPAIPAGPYSGSAIVYWDSGASVVGAPPLTNTPNRAGADPHEHPRRTAAARAQKSAFLQPNGTFVDVCGGGPCAAAPDVG
jgi:hypothetical protein